MKSVKILTILAVILMVAAVIHSCMKDDTKDEISSDDLLLKEMSSFGMPIFMGQNSEIGDAVIYVQDELIHFDVVLDPALLGDWYVTEAHLYEGEDAPPKSAPGQFPHHWNAGDDYPISFEFDAPYGYCEVFDWYFALHLALELEVVNPDGTIQYLQESAWLLPEEGGTYWTNKKGKTIGWGQYFIFTFDHQPEFTDIQLLADAGMSLPPDWVPSGNWFDVGGTFPDYSICLFENNPYYFFDIGTVDLTYPLMVGIMNEFYLDEVTDPAFFVYWDAKGVNASAATGTWQYEMWNIINAEPGYPMFYVHWDGTDYTLVDGLQFLTGQGMNPLRISGDYPQNTYSFTGTVQGEDCTSSDITITLSVLACL